MPPGEVADALVVRGRTTMSDASKAALVPAWQYEFRESVACSFCGNTERVVMCAPSAEHGVCEACSVHSYWIWKRMQGDFVPTSTRSLVKRVKVMVPRLVTLPDGQSARPDLPLSYEVLVVLGGGVDGMCDLPSADVGPGESEEVAVMRALGEQGLMTWSSCVEPLYAAHTMRGSVARLYLVTACAYADGRDSRSSAFRPLPLRDHVGASLHGYYSALDDVWPLRITKHRFESAGRDVCTILRRGAVEYIAMQLRLLKDPREDVSMAKFLRESMTDGEKLVCKLVLDEARLAEEKMLDEQAAKESQASAVEEYVEGGSPRDDGDDQSVAAPEVEAEDEEGGLEQAFREDG